MRAGLFGGTFNPIHNGHLMVARQAVRCLALDRLYIIPCRTPPHKAPDFLAPAAQRVRMIELALPADDRVVLSDIEIRRSGPSYTIDTVVGFSTRIVPAAELFLIMGLDAFLEIHTWRHQRRLLEMIQPVVVVRPADDGGVPERPAARMETVTSKARCPPITVLTAVGNGGGIPGWRPSICSKLRPCRSPPARSGSASGRAMPLAALYRRR